MTDSKNKIGSVLGGRTETGVTERKPITSVQAQAATQTTKQEQTRDKEDTEGRKYYQKTSKHPEWRKRTMLLPPDLITWLKIQAAIEGREMSEIAVDALEQYKLLHPMKASQE